MKEKITIQFGGKKSLDSAFEHFIQSRIVSNSAPETIAFYKGCYKYFLEFFGEGKLCEDITEDVIFEYLLYIKENKPDIAQKTVNTYIKGLRAIFYFMMKNGYVEEFKITLPKVEETIKETYTDAEIQQLIEKPKLNKDCTFADLRNWALVDKCAGIVIY